MTVATVAPLALLIGKGLLGLCLIMCVITFLIPHHKAKLGSSSKRGDASSQSHKTQPNKED